MLLSCCIAAEPTAVALERAAANPPRHVAIELLSDLRVVAAGQSFWLAFRERIEPGWHTYWINPGDSGTPTQLRVTAPARFEVGAIAWPTPELIPVGPLVNYGYSDEVLLLVPAKAPPGALAGPVRIAVEAEWLVCKDICIPERGTASLELATGAAAQPSADSARIAAQLGELPTPLTTAASVRVGPEQLELSVPGLTRAVARNPRFLPAAWGVLDNAASQPARWDGAALVLTLARGDLKGQPLPVLEGLLLLDAAPGAPARAYSVQASATATAPAPAAARGAAALSWPVAMLFAFVGGLILNLMPCVLPVLALKVLGLARAPQPRAVERAQAFAYLAGVLCACVALGAALVLLRGFGHAVGWGFQLQSPAFVMVLAALLFALALSLSGVYTIGATLAGAGEGLTRRPGLPGSFAVGVLATTAATPCTAPLMGAAIAYALSTAGWQGIGVMLALGLGFAAPLVLLHLNPGLRRWLPRPGAWMETLKQLLAFPLYASAAWLVWVLSEQCGSAGVLVALALLTVVGFCGWLAGRTQGSSWGPAAATAIAIGALGLALAATPSMPPGASAASAARAYSEATLGALRAGGRPVFLNVTAAWCITCQVNERVALNTERVRRGFREARVAYLEADWTRQDPAITALLERFGRDGVPLYVYFPPRIDAGPTILPQFLTENLLLATIAGAAAHP